MPNAPQLSNVEASGLLLGALAFWKMLGVAISWVASWAERRESARETKLEKWHAELEERERRIDDGQTAYTARLEKRMQGYEEREEKSNTRVQALRLAFEIVAGELRAKDPVNKGLTRAEQLLAIAFPLEPASPNDMQHLIAMLNTQPSVGLAEGERRK